MISSKCLLKPLWPLALQNAKAHRKPRWEPVAKSKIYRIPKRPQISEEERIELRRVTNNYKTQMRAIKRFFYEDMIKEQSTLQSASSEMSQKLEAEEWAHCIAINDKWNLQVAAEREERRKKELASLEEYALRRMEKKDKLKAEIIAKATEEIKHVKELSQTFITPETLDVAIDNAIANPVDYNYVIDLKGNRFQGRDTPITYPKDDKSKSVQN